MDNTTTARIDLQRLQILNDRLCQTLDALNQVRLTAHNVSTGINPTIGMGNPYLATPFWNQFAQQPVSALPANYGFGFGYSPMNAPAFGLGYPQQAISPFAGIAGFGTTLPSHVAPWASVPATQYMGGYIPSTMHGGFTRPMANGLETAGFRASPFVGQAVQW